jgi:putative SOS response-associated peptidase YedK
MMCTRFSLTAELVPYQRRYNISPTQDIPVIQQIGEERCLNQQRWGLMPYWGKNSIHADRDTLGEKPYLNVMLSKTRCVIPCSGFYYWKDEGKARRAWHVVHTGKSVFGMAGIYDMWNDSEKNKFPMCTVITTASSIGMDRALPLILDESAIDTWLNPKVTKLDVLRDVLRSLPDTEFRAYPVSPRVEDYMVETPECIAELRPSFQLMKK